MNKSALLVGASGLIGAHLLRCLLEAPEYKQVIALVRRPLRVSHPRLMEVVIDFADLLLYSDLFAVNDVFCCLGTTAKKTKSKDEYKNIDVNYPLEMGRMALKNKAEKFLVVTAMGANLNSGFFYNRIKGMVEAELKGLNLNSLHIFRPSLLTGKRAEHRPGERLAIILTCRLEFIFFGPLKKYKPIAAETVARSMYLVAQKPATGVYTYESTGISELCMG